MPSLKRIVFEGRINWGVQGLAGGPLIPSFHGKGGDGKRQAQRFKDHLDNGMSYIFPNGGYNAQGGEWVNFSAPGDFMEDVEYMDRLFAAIHGFWGTDPDAVYPNGFSAGGHFTNLLSVVRPTGYAGFGVLAALCNDATRALPLAGLPLDTPIPVFTLHGLEDHKSGYADGGKEGHLTPVEMLAWYRERTDNVGEPAPPVVVETGTGSEGTFIARRQTYPNDRLELVEVEGLGHTWPKQNKHGIDAAGMFLERMGLI